MEGFNFGDIVLNFGTMARVVGFRQSSECGNFLIVRGHGLTDVMVGQWEALPANVKMVQSDPQWARSHRPIIR